MAKRRFDNIAVNRLEIQREVIVGGDTVVDLKNAATDEKAKVSSNDTTPGFLNGKLVAGANITLTENNNGSNETLTISAAGGLSGFTATTNTSAPNATVNVSVLTADAPSSDADIVLRAKNTGSILAQVPDSAITGGDKRGSYSVDLQVGRYAASSVASGSYSTIPGGRNNKASGANSIASGGDSNFAEGSRASVYGGRYNVVGTGPSDAGIMSGGYNTISGGNRSIILGGESNTINNGSHSLIITGTTNTISSEGTIIHGTNNTVSAVYGCVLNGDYNTVDKQESIAFGSYTKPVSPKSVIFSSNKWWSARTNPGEFQRSFVALTANTAGTGTYYLTTDGTAGNGFGTTPDASNQIIIPNHTVVLFEAVILAQRIDSPVANAGWKITGMARSLNNTLAIVGTPTITLIGGENHTSPTAWTAGVDVDDSIKALRFYGAGTTGVQVRFGAFIELTQNRVYL